MLDYMDRPGWWSEERQAMRTEARRRSHLRRLFAAVTALTALALVVVSQASAWHITWSAAFASMSNTQRSYWQLQIHRHQAELAHPEYVPHHSRYDFS